jgi:hypothetical protein
MSLVCTGWDQVLNMLRLTCHAYIKVYVMQAFLYLLSVCKCCSESDSVWLLSHWMQAKWVGKTPNNRRKMRDRHSSKLAAPLSAIGGDTVVAHAWRLSGRTSHLTEVQQKSVLFAALGMYTWGLWTSLTICCCCVCRQLHDCQQSRGTQQVCTGRGML